MSEQYTPEPWHAHLEDDSLGAWHWYIKDDSEQTIAEFRTLKREDAARIVACVNACTGIPTEVLERLDTCALQDVLEGLPAHHLRLKP